MRVVSYNVLADAYINHAWYPHVDPYLLQPVPRRQRLLRFLESLKADALCLQEVEPLLAHQLGGTFSQKRREKLDGCLTTSPLPFTTETLYYSDRHKGRPSGHLAQLSIFELDGKPLGVANTHIKWDRPGTPESRQVGRQQILQLIERCQAGDWVLCGDFNAEPDSPLVTLLLGAGFQIASPPGPTCNVNQTPQQLDYIFISEGLQATPIPLPSITGATPLPNELQPSDHLPVSADIQRK